MHGHRKLDALISQIYFWNKTLHVSDSSPVHHQQFFTVHTANGICHKTCEQDHDGTSWSCSQSVSKPVWHTPLLCVQWKTLHVSDSSSVQHQEFFTVHTAMVYVTQVCWQIVSRIRTELTDPGRKLYDILPLLCVQWKTPNDGQRNCPKHVEFYSKNQFEKLVYLVGFVIRIYVPIAYVLLYVS